MRGGALVGIGCHPSGCDGVVGVGTVTRHAPEDDCIFPTDGAFGAVVCAAHVVVTPVWVLYTCRVGVASQRVFGSTPAGVFGFGSAIL